MAFTFEPPKMPAKGSKVITKMPKVEETAHIRRRVKVPGTDRTILVSEDMTAQFEQIFYGQYDRILDDLPLFTGDQFGNFEPALYLQLESLAPQRSFNVIGDPRIGQRISPNVPTDLRPSMVIQAPTPPLRVTDLLTTLACQVFTLSRGSSSYNWNLRAVVEYQTDHPIYAELGMPGKGWVCIRRATQDAVEMAVARKSVPGLAPGMESWTVLDPFPFPTLTVLDAFPLTGFKPNDEPQRRSSLPRGEMVGRIAALKVGEKFVGQFTSRVAIYAFVKRAKDQNDLADARFTIQDVDAAEGVYEVTRVR